MTISTTNAVAFTDLSRMHNTSGQVNLKQGEVITGSVIDVRDSSISLATSDGIDRKIVDFQLNQDLGFKIDDMLEIEVLKSSDNILELSIRKLEEEQKEIAKSHDPLSDSVNLDEVKKSIMTSNNPLQFSKQLDNHIEHAVSQVNTMLESFNDEEISAVLKENFDVTKMTIDLLYQVGHSNSVDKKIALSGDVDRTVSISVNEEKIDQLIQQYSGNNTLNKVTQESLEAIVHGLINNDIKPQPKNVEKVANFVEKVDKVKEMSPKEIVQFLSSNKESSVAELHKSLYISGKNVKNDLISEKDYKAIEPEVKRIVDRNFADFDQESIEKVLNIAKALVKKGIPIDDRAIQTIKYIEEPNNLEETIKIASKQMKKNEKPDKVIVTSMNNEGTILNKEDIKDFINLVSQVSKEDVKAVVLNNRQVSFRELEFQMEEVRDKTSKANISGKADAFIEVDTVETKASQEEATDDVQVIIDKNMENLQVIRYQMTYKAAMSLSIQGLDLKNTNLDLIRERLESFETLHIDTSKEMTTISESKSLKQEDVKIDLDESRMLTKKELAVLEVRKHMAIISASSTKSIANIALTQGDNVSKQTTNNQTVALAESEITLSSIVKSASAGIDRYDELRTMPRTDLGDSIEKAFANVTEILADLELENTSFNQRAVEILGRNEMPITIENIEAVKALDIELQELFTKLMPEHVKALVDLNVDIMNEPIDKLVEYVRSQDSLVQKDMQEQVAKHIMAMSKSNDITSEQKDALVGVYRMIHTIETSKGAAVGFLLNNNLEVNLENLFDAAKVIRQGQSSNGVINAQIDDAFGLLETLSKDTVSIKEQIQSGYLEKEIAVNNIMSKVLSGSTELVDNASISSAVQEEQMQEYKDLLTNIQEMQKGELKESLKLNVNANLSDIKAFDELSKNPTVMKDIFSDLITMNGDVEPLREKLQNIIVSFMDQLTPQGQEEFQKSMKEVLGEAKDFALKDYFEGEESENNSTLLKENSAFSGEKSVFQTSKELESHLSLQKQLISNEDYYSLPVMINGEMQHMSMYYLKQESEDLSHDDDMSVYFSFTTENLGTANIRVQLKDQDSNVTMYATKDSGNRQLKNYEEDFRDLFNDVGLAVTKMKYDTFILPTPVKPDQKIATANKVSKYSQNIFEKSI